MGQKVKVIALTGGFSTGKSTVGRMFEDLGVPRIDADQLTHQMISPDRTVWRQIVSAFGEGILESDRRINRHKLADIIFSDPKRRKRLEAIIHPKVREKMHEEMTCLCEKDTVMVILEIPLLYEVGWDKEEKLDAVIVVTADEKQQVEQARRKFNLSEAAIQARMDAQLPLEEKAKKADFVIDNSGDLASTRKQVEKIFERLQKIGS